MRVYAAAALCLFAFSTNADAKPRKVRQTVAITCGAEGLGCVSIASPQRQANVAHERRQRHVRVARQPRESRARVAVSQPASVLSTVSAPAQFVRGRLICAVNVGVALAERGIRGTGSALAKSYLNWGRPSGPVPGAVAVFSRGKRGGHVAIVHSVNSDGTVIYLNPSSRRQAWQVGPYSRTPMAYRVAS